MSVQFQNYPTQHHSADDASPIYNDFINHCRSWRQMIVRGRKITSAHECTHGINSELRLGRFGAQALGEMALDIVFKRVGDSLTLIQPNPRAASFQTLAERMNGFYVGEDRGVLLPEPRIRKSQVAKYVPSALRGYRYQTYITGQTAWDDTPLYVFDEWVAYNNGTLTANDLNARGDSSGKGEDQPMGPLEFLGYAVALCMAVDRLDSPYYQNNPNFTEFMKFEIRRSVGIIQQAIKCFPWQGAQQTYNSLCAGPLNEFALSKFGLDLKNPEPSDDGLDFQLLSSD